ncbi:MAG: threonine/serine dehydratase [Clostridia bacterium]
MNFDILAAQKRLSPWIIKTPLVENEFLSKKTGKKVFLKLESMQRTGAFKFRGAMNYMIKLDKEEAKKGVITASSGNHGLGMSLSGKLNGVNCTVVMPTNAPKSKQKRAKEYGAKVILKGLCYDDAQEHAKELAKENNLSYVPSFNHQDIIEGQGTILAEIIQDQPDVDMVIVPVGGGGMLAGLLVAKEQLGVTCDVVGVEPFGACGMKQSLELGKVTTVENMNTLADGVAVRTPGDLNFSIAKKYMPKLLNTTDEQILKTQELLLKQSKIIVETAGGVSVSGILNNILPDEVKVIVCVISGANLDLIQLKEFLK